MVNATKKYIFSDCCFLFGMVICNEVVRLYDFAPTLQEIHPYDFTSNIDLILPATSLQNTTYLYQLLSMISSNYTTLLSLYLTKLRSKILTIAAIKWHAQKCLGEGYTDAKIYKTLYTMKKKWLLVALKKDIFVLQSAGDALGDSQLLDHYYRLLLRNHSHACCKSDRYIGGLKAIELHLSNFEIPMMIDIMTTSKHCQEVVMLDHKVLFKSYQTKSQISLFRVIKKHCRHIPLGNKEFLIAPLEIALLESLYSVAPHLQHRTEDLVKKVITKYRKTLQADLIISVIQLGKHHSSLQYLHRLTQEMGSDWSHTLALLIKQYSH